MIIRVDDMPSGRDADPESVIKDWFPAFKRFHASMGGTPYTLGVVPKWVKPSDLEWLRSQPNVTIACHGFSHARCEFDVPEHMVLKILREADAVVHSDIFIPPFNYLNYQLLRALNTCGYKYVTTGPETAVSVMGAAGSLRVVPPVWYGRAREFVKKIEHEGDWIRPHGCLVLHWTWEWSDDYVALREMLGLIAGSVVPWYEGVKETAV